MADKDVEQLVADLEGKDNKTIMAALDKSSNPAAKKIYLDATKASSGKVNSGSSSSLTDTLATSLSEGFKLMTTDANRMLGLKLGPIISAMANGESGVLGTLKGILEGTLTGVGQIMGSLASIDADARKQVVQIGGYYGDLANGMMSQMMDIMGDVAQLGVSSEDVTEGVGYLANQAGRMATYSRDTIVQGLEASTVFTTTNRELLQNAEKFRNVGLGLADAAKSVTNIGRNSVSLGLNAKKVGDEIIKNVEKLNQYGFKNGIEGLGKMVQESQSLNISVDKTFNIAEKLFDPAAAIDMTANLQALGGAFGDFADPIKLMYDATNNVDGLQKSLIGAARGLATYNAEQGRFEVAGANLRRANEIAKTLGMTTGELANTAVKAAVKFDTMSKLDMFPSLTKDQKEFVSNLATMKDGKIGFDLPEDVAKQIFGDSAEGGFRSIEQMGGNIAKFQEIQKKIADKKPEELAREQYNAITNIANTVSGIAYRMGASVMKSNFGAGVTSTASTASKYVYENFAAKGKSSTEILNEMKKEAVRELAVGSKAIGESVLKMLNISPENIKKIETNISDDMKKVGNRASEIIKKTEEYISPYLEKAKAKIMGNSSNYQPNINNNVNGTLNLKHEIIGNPFKDSKVIDALCGAPQFNNHIKNIAIDAINQKSKKGQYDNSQMG